MNQYAKFVSEKQIELAPLSKGSVINYNLNEKMLKKDGYKPLVKAEHPSENRIYEITYSFDEDYIYENISYLESDEEYKKRIGSDLRDLKVENLKSRINGLDYKRIRALCEPSVKDETSGETWLDYYNKQIVSLRNEIKELEEINVAE